ncbi:MAG TPA: phosphate ABC transporter permease PstA [Methanoregulaceae archaeon]|nr:phosphate ABC transporter permease PstA [Methanoregulaceae archaeon]
MPTTVTSVTSPPHLPRAHAPARREQAFSFLWFACALMAVVTVGFILASLVIEGLPAFNDTGVLRFVLGDTWNPTFDPPSYGILPLLAGTLLVTLGAMAISVPLSLGAAIYLAELAPARVREVVRPAVELLAGIPSVVYGFFGLVVLVEWLRVTLSVPSGESVLAGSILLGIMSLPTILSVSEDALFAVGRDLREGSLALGATRWQTISQVVVPAALPGISAAVILGMGRAIGETMAVLMVTGNAAVIPEPLFNILSPVRTLTGTLGIEMGEVAIGSPHYHALFAVATVLLAVTLVVNLGATALLSRLNAAAAGRSMSSTPGRLVASLFSTRVLLGLAAGIVALVAGSTWGLIPALGVLSVSAVLSVATGRLSRRQSEAIAFALFRVAVVVVLLALALILFDIVSKGLPAISWEFLAGTPKDLGRGGGIFPAIFGTLCLVAGSIAFALPIGVGAAIHLVEYRSEGRVTRAIRSGVDLLNGTPSIVFGLFGFSFLVLHLNLGVSMLAGQLTLGLMVLPTIIRTAEEALRNVPQSLREGSLALGATRWQTISRVVLPTAAAGIVTGTILSIGRAAGETAPILFTAVVFSQRQLPGSLFEPVMALPYHLFVLSTTVPGSDLNRYGTALVLILVVCGIYAVAIAVRNRFSTTMRL